MERREKRRIRRKRTIMMMSLKNILRRRWICLCCRFGNPYRLDCMIDRIWSFIPYDFPS
jgi:hypothetical protein